MGGKVIERGVFGGEGKRKMGDVIPFFDFFV